MKKSVEMKKELENLKNEIIRLNPKDWFIVNGCAGSGKTTILLQRIAYLMYQAKDKRMSDMLLLSRNQLFAKYIYNNKGLKC